MPKGVMTMAAVVVLSAGLAAVESQSALARDGSRLTTASRATHPIPGVHGTGNHRKHGLVRPPGYAGLVTLSAAAGDWTTEPGLPFVPARGLAGGSCDLPTSACSDDERISN